MSCTDILLWVGKDFLLTDESQFVYIVCKLLIVQCVWNCVSFILSSLTSSMFRPKLQLHIAYRGGSLYICMRSGLYPSDSTSDVLLLHHMAELTCDDVVTGAV